jgi:hypothetical protein
VSTPAPGVWFPLGNEVWTKYEQRTPEGTIDVECRLAVFDDTNDEFDQWTPEGNAQLAAASAELLTACRAAALELQTVGVNHGHTHAAAVLALCDAAIAKAEDRTRGAALRAIAKSRLTPDVKESRPKGA